MTRSAHCVGLLATMAVSLLGSVGRAQPTIGKDQIPTELPDEMRQKIEALYSTDAKERARATGEAVSYPLRDHWAAVVPFLVAMLHDDVVLYDEKELLRRELISSHWRVFRYPNAPGETAAEVLAGMVPRMGRPEMTALFARLDDENAVVRANVLRTLGELLGHDTEDGRRATVAKLAVADTLIKCLGDREAKVRHHAAVVFRYVEDPRAVEPLTGLVEKDPLWETRAAAATALGTAKDRRAVQALATRLEDPFERVEVRVEAAGALGKIGDPDAAGPLVGALDADDSRVRRAAVQAAAGAIRDPGVLWSLMTKALSDKDWQVRDGATAAVPALARLGDPTARDLLVRTLGDEHPNVRADAARALGELKDPAAVVPLVAVLQVDENAYVRWHAAVALGDLGDPRAADALTAAMKDEDEIVRARAKGALEKLKKAPR